MATKIEPLPKRVCVDWDNTITMRGPYEGPFQHHPIRAEALPIINHLEFLGYEVVVLTGRPAEEHKDILRRCQTVGLHVARVTNVKEPAIIYIDDRGYHFTAWGDHIVDAVIAAEQRNKVLQYGEANNEDNQ